jgi:succinate dehydrogenase / fumarate reductase flavoprotein subunit
MNRQIGRGKIKSYTRHEMQDLVVIDGKGEELLLDLVTGEIERPAHAVVIALEDTEMYFLIDLCDG